MRLSNLRYAVTAATLCGGMLSAQHALASAPAGVWVKVQNVVYEPNALSATRVQIHGAIMVYDKSTTGPYPGYTKPASGYMYYECPVGKETICRSEWADLAANISQPIQECKGFGHQSLPTGTLRASSASATNPDQYPIQNGVSPGWTPCQALKDFLEGQAGSGGSGGNGSGGGDSGGTSGTESGGTGSGGTSTQNTGGTSTGGTDTGTTGGTGGSPAAGGKDGQSESGGSSPSASGGVGGTNSNKPNPTSSAAEAEDDGGCSVAGVGGAAPLGAGFALWLSAMLLGRRRGRRKE